MAAAMVPASSSPVHAPSVPATLRTVRPPARGPDDDSGHGHGALSCLQLQPRVLPVDSSSLPSSSLPPSSSLMGTAVKPPPRPQSLAVNAHASSSALRPAHAGHHPALKSSPCSFVRQVFSFVSCRLLTAIG